MAGQIIKRGDRAWTVRIYLGRGADGARQYQNHTIHGVKQDAQKWLNDALTKKDLGIPTFQTKLSLSDYLGTWLKTVAKPRVSEQTFNSYEWLLGRITPKLGKVRLSQLRAEDIQKAYGSLPSSTARHVHAPLRSALRQAVKWHLIYANPCDSVELPRHQASETEWLTKEEAGRFLAVDGKYACLFAFLLDTGSRPSEALGLKWTDVDLEKGNVTIQRTLQWHATGGFYFGETKTKGSRRTIPLSASMARRIKEHRRTQAEKLLKIGVRSDLVFSNTEGAPLQELSAKALQASP
jgi:integrase